MTTSKNLVPRGHFSHMAAGNEVEKVKTTFTYTEHCARTFLIFEALLLKMVEVIYVYNEYDQQKQ